MSNINLSTITHGIHLQSEDFLKNAHILHGTGQPGDAGNPANELALQNAAPIGTVYMRTDTETNGLQFYWKYRTSQNSFGDWHQSVSIEHLSSIVNGISWREPANVLDSTTYADITAAETALNTNGTVDGITINPGDRILYTDLTTGNDNVYIVGGTAPNNLTLTEDTNAVSDGDTVLIKEGTEAEAQWTFDGTTWVQTGGSTNANELAHIRDFIGKNGTGAENPAYSSVLAISQGSSLEAAIGVLDSVVGDSTFTESNFVVNNDTLTDNIDALDVQLGTGAHNSSNILATTNDVTENLEALDTAIGDRNYTTTTGHILTVDGETLTASLEKLNIGIGDRQYTNGYHLTNSDTITKSLDDLDIALGDPNHSSTNIIANNADINTNLSSLDSSIGNRTYSNDNVVADGETLTASIDALDSQLGNNTFTESNVVVNTNNITQNLDAIDQTLGNIDDQTKTVKTANVGAQTAIDSLPMVEAEVAKWIIGYEDVNDPTHRQSVEIHAIHNGTSVKFDKYSGHLWGSPFTGLEFDVDINAGSLRLLLTSATTPVDVAVRRIGYFTIN
jgi:hypothetical protein